MSEAAVRGLGFMQGAGRAAVLLLCALGATEAAAGCAAVYPEVAAPVRPFPAGTTPSPPPPPDLVYLHVDSALVPRLTRGGQAWDAVGNEAPDPFVVVSLDGREVLRTPSAPDTYSPDWSHEIASNLWAEPTAVLRVELWNANTLNNVPICVRELRNWRTYLKEERLRLDCPGGAEVTLGVEPARPRAGLGLRYELRTNSVFVTRVARFSPASRAGVLPGDELVSVQGKAVAGMDPVEFRSLVNANAPTGLTLELRTGGEPVRKLELKEGVIYPMPGEGIALR